MTISRIAMSLIGSVVVVPLMLVAVAPPSSATVVGVSASAVKPAKIAPYTVSPGKFGLITMGVSTRAYALRVGYLVRSRVAAGDESVAVCWPDRWAYSTHVGDYADFRQVADGVRKPADKVSLWVSSPRAVTSKGLRTSDPISKLKKLYPSAVRRAGVTEYGEKYSVYTVRGKYGYLDIVRNWMPGNTVSNANFFVVRSLTTSGPQYIMDTFSEGLGCGPRDF